MNIAQRLAVYHSWREQGDLPGYAMYFGAYEAPSWSRGNGFIGHQAQHGWTDYQNAAALRQLTQGEAPASAAASREVKR